jgi:hypothetical protein
MTFSLVKTYMKEQIVNLNLYTCWILQCFEKLFKFQQKVRNNHLKQIQTTLNLHFIFIHSVYNLYSFIDQDGLTTTNELQCWTSQGPNRGMSRLHFISIDVFLNASKYLHSLNPFNMLWDHFSSWQRDINFFLYRVGLPFKFTTPKIELL